MNENMKIKYFDDELEVYDERRVVNKNTYSITLNYVPSPTRPFTVENGKTILTETQSSPNANQYVLDRENGLLLFNPAMKGKMMTMNYSAIGMWCISADKIFTNVDNKGKIVETLEDLMRENRQAIESIKAVGDASAVITQLQADIDSVTGLVGNIAEGSSVNEELTQNIESGEGVNATLINTISSANNKINEMNTWVNQHENIVNLDNRVDTVETEIPKINELLEHLDKKENKYFQLAPLPSGGDDTETIQNLIGSNKTILLPFGATYKLNSININNISNLTIIGNNSKFLKNNGNGAMINISECSFVTIKNLEMDYSLTLTSPTNEDSCITVNNYSYIEINSCKFVNFKNVAINLKTAKDSFGNNGGTTSTPCLIEKCKFLDQANLSTNTYATSILLGEDSEYCKILYNEFRNVWSAIRGYGANSLIDGNTIMDCRATFIPSNGLIYLHSDDGVNSGKHIISNNMINHNEKGATAIYCVGNLNREEKRFTIINNNILVHGLSNDTNGYGIGVNNADASLISGNYIKVKPNNKCNILVENSSNVIVTNNTLQNSVGINGTNSTFHENNNIFINTVKDVLCLDNSRIIEKTYIVRLRWNGEISPETTLKDITCEKNGTGTLILSHNFGHIRYVVNAIVDADTRFAIPVITRTENTIEVRCFDNDGALTDRSVMLIIHTS